MRAPCGHRESGGGRRPPRAAVLLAATCLLAATWPLAACNPKPKRWVACYNAEIAPDALRGYDLIVVDGGYRGDLRRLKTRGASVLAYISLGEVAAHRPWFARARAAGLLVEENPNWKGSWTVDVRKRAWRELVQRRVTTLLARGFDGLFLDTLDSPLHLERTGGTGHGGMAEGLVRLVRDIARRHPKITLMMNGGLPLVGPLRDQVHMLAMESTLTAWDFKSGKARWRTDQERRWVANVLRKARAANPKLAIYTLDYWDPDDLPGVRRIYSIQRADGLVPYVATIGLDRVVAEPAPGAPEGGPAPSTPSPLGRTP